MGPIGLIGLAIILAMKARAGAKEGDEEREKRKTNYLLKLGIALILTAISVKIFKSPLAGALATAGVLILASVVGASIEDAAGEPFSVIKN